MYTTEAAAAGRVILCGSQKQNLYFLLELESVQLLKRVLQQIDLFMILVQSVFNDHKDLLSIIVHLKRWK